MTAALPLVCPFKRVLATTLFKAAGAFTQGEAEVLLKLHELMGEDEYAGVS